MTTSTKHKPEGAPKQMPSLQSGIDKAGSATDLLWKPNAAHWNVPVLQAEYQGWGAEQKAWRDTVAISDLSHHMADLFIRGKDAKRLLMECSANDFENFEIGQAKQFVPVTEEGYLITDGILLREGDEAFTLSGVPSSQNWVKYHGMKNGYDVTFTEDPDSERRQGDPVLFRFQIQGPHAPAVVEKVFGGPLPKTKFFHSVIASLQGRSIRALRHGMVGQPGYEFIGDYKDGAWFKDLLMTAGEEFAIAHVGGKAYFTNGLESGWIPSPTAGIYTAPSLKAYREWLPLFSFEGQKPLHGTFYSRDFDQYYCTPFELGYGRSVKFNHDFIGRDALERLKGETGRTRVNFVWDKDDAARAVPGNDYFLSYARYRIEVNGKMVGVAYYSGRIDPIKEMLSLGLIDTAFATPGTRVELVFGEHLGKDAPANMEDQFVRVGATVAPSPFNEVARTTYRQN